MGLSPPPPLICLRKLSTRDLVLVSVGYSTSVVMFLLICTPIQNHWRFRLQVYAEEVG